LLTVVSSGRSERSRVVPEGTVMPDKTMVEHDFCDLLAEAAPLEPVKVQLVARFTSNGLGAGVIAGRATATGDATAAQATKATNKVEVNETIFEEVRLGSGYLSLIVA
jgi:hypothetical protein